MINQVSPFNTWQYALSSPRGCFGADSPTIGQVIEHFGIDVASKLIEAHITQIFLMSNCRDAGMANTIGVYSGMFASKVRPYKVSEIVLFFAKYSLGMYDKSFAGFDTKRIGDCFFNRFIPERFDALESLENEQRQKERARYEKYYHEMASKIPLGMSPRQWANHTIEAALLAHPHACAIIDNTYKQTRDEILNNYKVNERYI